MNPTVRSRQLGGELRKFRQRSRLTCEKAGLAVGMSTAKISRIETGKHSGTVADIALLLGLYRVPKAKQDELLDLCTGGNNRGWWQRHGSHLPNELKTLIGLENDATAIRTFQAMFVPGLLQTGEYMRAFMLGSGLVSEAEIEERVMVRLGRQAMLSRPRPPQFDVLIDEQALRRPVGGAQVMHEQLEHLRHKASREHISLRVVPTTVGAHAGMSGPFVLLEFDKVPPCAYLENETSSLFLEEESDIATYQVILAKLAEVALNPEESASLVARLATEYAQMGNGAPDDQPRAAQNRALAEEQLQR